MTPDKEATTTDWRELVRRIQKEEDPEKVFELRDDLGHGGPGVQLKPTI